ncbi:SHOCT domain-containing protein [Saccharomonospora sp. NPDC046836]|uniref:SHOCT domain-containing protein n=1 Tax=Saccharomonospora sp. NPDC046836 TaxID=3156921 RepID=UPI0033F9AD52
MYWYDDGLGPLGYTLIAVTLLLFVGLVVSGLVALFRFLSRDTTRGRQVNQAYGAEQILAERFARGEIDEEEYSRRLEALRANMDRGSRR